MSEINDISSQIKIGNVLYAILEKIGSVEVTIDSVLKGNTEEKQLVLDYSEDNSSFIIKLGDKNGNN